VLEDALRPSARSHDGIDWQAGRRAEKVQQEVAGVAQPRDESQAEELDNDRAMRLLCIHCADRIDSPTLLGTGDCPRCGGNVVHDLHGTVRPLAPPPPPPPPRSPCVSLLGGRRRRSG
jgi:hypothetical protein